MLFSLRFALITLWLLITSLILPEFKLGGRYQVLLIAFIAVVVLEMGSHWFGKLSFKLRAIVNSLMACLSLGVGVALFNGVSITLFSLIMFSLGVIGTERLVGWFKQQLVRDSY